MKARCAAAYFLCVNTKIDLFHYLLIFVYFILTNIYLFILDKDLVFFIKITGVIIDLGYTQINFDRALCFVYLYNSYFIFILEERTFRGSDNKNGEHNKMTTRRFLTGYDVLLDRRANKVKFLK
jgi:hypothetical protein